MFAALKFQELATGGLSSQPRARSIRVKENFKKDLLQHINTTGTKQQLTHPAWLKEYENSIKVLLKLNIFFCSIYILCKVLPLITKIRGQSAQPPQELGGTFHHVMLSRKDI